MNMGLIKSIYVLTLVITILIINDHKSDANGKYKDVCCNKYYDALLAKNLISLFI